MKHIDPFPSYHEISSADWFDSQSYDLSQMFDISDKSLEILRRDFNLELRTPTKFVHSSSGPFRSYSYRSVSIRLSNIQIDILEAKDEYFYVAVLQNYDLDRNEFGSMRCFKYFKCDQIEGVVSLLRSYLHKRYFK